MAILFAMLCGWVVVLRKFASRKHDRLKNKYETVNESFQLVERDCKNDEVAVGRPGSYSAELRLMKLYESVEQAKQNWIAASQKLVKRQKMEERLKGLRGRKIPYTFGLLDMAVVIKGIDAIREAKRFDLSFITDLINSIF